MVSGLNLIPNLRSLTHPRSLNPKHRVWRSFVFFGEVCANPNIQNKFLSKPSWVRYKIKYLSLAKWPWVY